MYKYNSEVTEDVHNFLLVFIVLLLLLLTFFGVCREERGGSVRGDEGELVADGARDILQRHAVRRLLYSALRRRRLLLLLPHLPRNLHPLLLPQTLSKHPLLPE